MKIVIIGAGKVGEYLIDKLADENHDIIVIEKQKNVLERVLSEHDVTGVLGNGADYDILKEAKVDIADCLIAVTLEDNVNIIASVMAKKIGVKYTIARVREPHYMDHMHFMQKNMGVDLLINPEYQAAKEILGILKYPYATGVEMFLKGRVNMVQMKVQENSPLCNKSLNELSRNNEFSNCLISIVNRDDKIFIPKGDFKLQGEDIIHVAANRENLDRFHKNLTHTDKKIHSVLIIGAGRISYYLVELLIQRGFEVKVIEKDKEKSVEFLKTHPKCIVINADGTDPDILEEERISSYDSLVALTGIDEENILLSMISEKFNVLKNVIKVDRQSLLRITGILDLDSTISPKRSIANIILRIIRSKENVKSANMKNLYRLEDNRVEAIEFDIKKDSRATKQKLCDIKLKSETIIGYIQKGDEVIIPGGNHYLDVNDRVVVITKQKHITDIEDILE